MSSASDFVIENGVLTKYVGSGGDVVVPEGVTSIGDSAFYDCSSLVSLTLPEGVRKIGNSVFSNCESLASITLPDSVTSIGDWAFRNCRSLKSITLPEGVTSIGNWAFFECRSLTSVTLPEGVTSIGKLAFSECRSLVSITLPEGVRSIGGGAFEHCSSLVSITLPDSVTEIGMAAFKECGGLMRADLPTEYATITMEMFSSCDHLLSVTGAIPLFRDQAISILWNDMLPLVILLRREEVDLTSEANSKIVEGIKKKKKDFAPRVIRMNDGFAMQRFLGLWKKIKLDELDDYIRIAGEEECSEALAVLMEYKRVMYSAKDIEKEESAAIQKALGERELSVSDWRKIFRLSISGGKASILEYIGNDPDVTVPDHVGKNVVVGIKQGAFENRTDVIRIELPETLNYIDRYALQNTGITEIEIPATVKSIDYSAFSNCASLQQIHVHSKNRKYKSIDGALYDKKAAVLIRWPEAGSNECYMPETVEAIDSRAFDSCKKLDKIVWSSSVKKINSVAFCNCTNLKELLLPEGIETIGIAAFSGCKGLQRVIFPEIGPEIIEKSVFERCDALNEVHFGRGTKKIYHHAFYGCAALKEIAVGPETVMLGKAAFEQCQSLTAIHIPASVTAIGDNCFIDCPNLTIHAPAGSYAEQYAKENNIPFVTE